MIKLLVVDDEVEFCNFVSNFFRRRGHLVFVAHNPQDVLAILEKEKPHLILLDILMPQMSGLELLRRIRERDKKVKIIMVSVADEPSNVEMVLSLGADDFLRKPFTVNYLEEVVLTRIHELMIHNIKED